MYLIVSTSDQSPFAQNYFKDGSKPTKKLSFVFDQLQHIYNDTLNNLDNLIILDLLNEISQKELNNFKAESHSKKHLIQLIKNSHLVKENDPLIIRNIIKNRPICFFSPILDKNVLLLLYELNKINIKIIGFGYPAKRADGNYLCNAQFSDTGDFIRFVRRTEYTCKTEFFRDISIIDIIGLGERLKPFLSKKEKIVVLQGVNEFLKELIIDDIENKINVQFYELDLSTEKFELAPKEKYIYLKNAHQHPALRRLLNELKLKHPKIKFLVSSKEKIQNRIASNITTITVPKGYLPNNVELFLKLAYNLNLFRGRQSIIYDYFWQKVINNIPTVQEMNKFLLELIDDEFYFHPNTYDTWYYLSKYINDRYQKKTNYKYNLIFTRLDEKHWKITGSGIDIHINKLTYGFLYIIYLIMNYEYPQSIHPDALYNEVQEWVTGKKSYAVKRFAAVRNSIRYVLEIDKKDLTKERPLSKLSFLLELDESGNKIVDPYIYISESECYYNPRSEIKIEIKHL